MKLDNRKTIYALLFSAMVLNIAYGVWYDGLDIPFKTSGEGGHGSSPLEFRLTPLRASDRFMVSQNLTLLLETEGGDASLYSMQSGLTRELTQGALVQRQAGDFSIHYSKNGSREVDLSGTIDRTTESRFGTETASDRVATTIIASGPKIAQTTSSVEVTLPGSCRAIGTLPWLRIASEYMTFTGSDTSTLGTDLSVGEVGISIPGFAISWMVRSLEAGPEGLTLALSAKGASNSGFSITYEIVFREGIAWPVLSDIRTDGTYRSDEGSVSIAMRLREELLEAEAGSGPVIPASSLIPREGASGPALSTDTAGPVPAIGEGESAYVSCPLEALGSAIEGSNDVSMFVESHGRETLTPIHISYSRNESRPAKEAWVWNVTLGAPGSSSWTPTLSFQVQNPRVPEKIDLSASELIGVQTGEAAIYPVPERTMVTLCAHESVLRASSFSENLFMGDNHAPSFRLDIVCRGDQGADPLSAIFLNLLGMERATAPDLFISTAVDRLDPKVFYMVVVDGSDGGIVSLTKAEGAFPLLLSTYGFDLA